MLKPIPTSVLTVDDSALIRTSLGALLGNAAGIGSPTHRTNTFNEAQNAITEHS
jgi:hypothetical protein